MAEAMTAILERWYTEECGTAGKIEAPYWDEADGSDAGETFDPDAQPWYDDLAEVVITAFLSTLVTPAAAVTFVTVTRRLRIAFRKNNYSGIFKLFIDGDEVATVDAYSPTEALDYIDVIVPA